MTSDTRENLNTVIGGLGLALAILSLAIQAWPSSESLTIDEGQIVWNNEPMEVRTTIGLPQGNRSMIGPLYWKFVITNQGDKAASLKSVSALLKDAKWGEYFVSGAFDGLSLEGSSQPALPISIPPHESRAIVARGYLPGWLSFEAQTKCMMPHVTIKVFNDCSINSGTDLFGNKLSLIKGGDRVLGVEWPSPFYQPSIKLTFVSGTGIKYSSIGTLIPFAAR